MTISIKSVLRTLQELGIPYSIASNFDEDKTYEIASLFAPTTFGFYFIKGNLSIANEIKGSLFLTDNPKHKKEYQENIFIEISEDTQRVYYSILDKIFGRKSTGKISKLTEIHPDAEIGKNVQIDAFCVIGKCKIGDNVVIGSHCKLHDNTEIERNTIIESMSVIGTQGVAWIWNETQTQKIVQPQLGGVKIGKNCFLGANTIIVRGSLNEYSSIGDYTLMAPSSRLGHGTQIGKQVHLANNVITGGNTHIDDYSFIGSGAIFRPKTKIHPKTIVGAGALVIKNTTQDGKTLVGVPAKEINTKLNPAGMPKPKL